MQSLRLHKRTLCAAVMLTAGALPLAARAATYSYDNLDRLVGVTYESGQVITYAYDAAGNITGISSGTGIPIPADALCGSADGTAVIAAPTNNLCASGTPSAVTGAGPWNWSCTGVNGGQAASCAAPIQSYTVIFQSGGNGTLSASASQTVKYGGSTSQVTAMPAAGYHFVNWTGTGGFVTTTSNPLTVGNVTGAMTITANFAPGSATYTLAVAISGNGTVNSNPSGFSCASGSCTQDYPTGSSFDLLATPSNSIFAGWSGDCSGATCSVVMDANKSVTATFTALPPVRIGGATPIYLTPPTLQNTYNSAGNGAVIEMKSGALDATDTLTANDPAGKSITLKGGFDAAYSSNSGGSTTISGPLTIGRGTVNVEKVNVR